MSDIATISNDELQELRGNYAELVAEGRVLDPASEADRYAVGSIVPFLVSLLDEVLRQREWARRMVEKAASGGTLDGYRELGEKIANAEAQIDRLRAALIAACEIVQTDRMGFFQANSVDGVIDENERDVLAQYDRALAMADAALGVQCERVEPAKEPA